MGGFEGQSSRITTSASSLVRDFKVGTWEPGREIGPVVARGVSASSSLLDTPEVCLITFVRGALAVSGPGVQYLVTLASKSCVV